MQGDWYLERAIFDTIRFFSLLDMPVTEVQIWRSLVVARDDAGQRWHGHHAPSLRDIRETLHGSAELKNKVGSLWGYWWLRSAVSREMAEGMTVEEAARQYVRRRLTRHALAQQKWKIARRVVRWFELVPLVKMIGGSGSLAWFNTNELSDLDLLVIVKSGRIWTARALLMLISQTLGRRRKYWDEISPDKICLNHYIADEPLLMNRAVRNLYMAQQYNQVVPLTGWEVFNRWLEANQVWLRQYVIYPERPLVPSRLYVQGWPGWEQVKRWLESWLLELPGDWTEAALKRMQLRAIKKHEERREKAGRARGHDRIVITDDELAFHPQTKVPMILNRYYEEEGQKALL